MPRPRTPSNVLELRGAFKKDPQRKREDHPGVGEFSKAPPAHLPQGVVHAWHEVVKRVPLEAMSGSDELAVEITASLLATWWLNKDMDTLKELRQWFAQLGLTPVARTKIPAPKKGGGGNPFADS
jgi:phage terminase small subunit